MVEVRRCGDNLASAGDLAWADEFAWADEAP
jgi:hypothetical protein